MIPRSQKFEHLQVQCTGKKVKISQKGLPREKPLMIEGGRIELQAESEKQLVVHVQGIPALIHDQRFKIEGKDIHLDRGGNRAWVTGAGELKLPIPDGTKLPSLEGNANRDLVVHWNESMNFNGQDAKFIGRVEAKLGYGKMHCEQMVVQLVRRINFQADQFDTNPTINSIRCRESVSFEHSTYAENKLVDVYRGRVGEFDWNYASGDVVAQGPGEVRVWQRNQKENGFDQKGSGFDAGKTILANRPIPTEITTWNYTRVQFEGRLQGNFDGTTAGTANRQRATIDDRVEVVHGPVGGPNEVVDPDKLTSMAGTMRCDRLQVVNHAGSERPETKDLELVCRGNAEVEGQVSGQEFTASADEISFDGSKDLFILRSHGRQDATLTGVGIGKQSGQTISFNPDPKKKTVKIDRASNGQISR